MSPEKELLKKVTSLSLVMLIVTSYNPQTALLLSSIEEDEYIYAQLTQEDRAYNQVQIQTSSDGFLLKNASITTESSSPKVNFLEHEVKESESLEDIANEYGINVSTIVWENNIINVEEVLPGDKLKILPADGLSYVVKRGDTLSKIAAVYDVDVTKVQSANIINGPIQIGQKLFIPDATQINKIDTVDEPVIADAKPEDKPTPEPQQSQVAQVDTPDEPVIVASLPTDVPDVVSIPNLPEQNTLQPKEVPDQEAAPKIPERGDLDISESIVTAPDPEIVDLPAVDPNVIKQQETISAPVSIDPNVELIAAPANPGEWGKVTKGIITNGYKAGHYALDIADRSKPPIWASKDGVVEVAKYGWNGGYGNYIIINHGDGYKTLYAHNEVLYVEEGQQVVKGQQISKMGATGRVYGATGIHVHYECRKDGVKINPHSCMAKL